MSNVPGQSFQPGTAVAPCSKVEVSVSCRNLRDKDVFSKSDPMCVLYVRDVKSNTYYEFGRTEMIKDTLKPDFVKKFIMDYYFEESQKLKFEIYDVDSSSGALSSHDFLGRMECTLGEIVGCGSGRIERKLVGIQGNAFIYVRAEEISSSKEHVFLHMRATGLDKKDFFGKSDPFLLFYRANGDGSYTVVHKTEVIKNTLNPTWKPFSITARSLCNGDHNRTIKIECYDWDSDGGSHDFIGEFTTTLADLVKAPTSNTTYDVINPKKKAKKRNYKHSGELMVMDCRVEIVPSFLDYLQGGVDMNFTVAIDFTASNGNPSSPTSLHYYDPYRPNQYASAIQAVGEIIQDYDTDKMFPVLGFGAKLPNGSVSHEFPCNFDANNPYCAGIQGIMQAYYTSMRQVQLYGPTNFSPVINHVAKFAASKTDGSNYFVLLIITDGVITDMPQTINAIVQASHLPMSIIIVGVGDAEFDAMDILDADGKRLGIDGRYAERDIVQFVPFREFMRGQYSNNQTLSQAALAKAVLAEIPEQVTYYMKKRGFKPKPQRKTAPPSSVPAAGQVGGQGPGVQPYQPGQPGGAPNTAPYPQGGPGAPPYPQSGASGSAPYPQGGAPGSAPYPQAGAPGTAPYPQAGAPGTAPYPQGGAPGSAPPGGPGAPPYPQGGPGAPPYPQGGPGSAPYPQSGAPGSAPYPQAGGPGTAPYPQAGVQGSNPQPTAPPGAPQRPPPTYQNSRQTNI